MNGKIVAFGEIMLRLSAPAGSDVRDCTAFDACYGGTEANVLACLNNFGHTVKYLTALPANGLGEATKAHLSRFNIDTSDIRTGGDNLGVYFVENGSGSRGANVIYYRSNSEFTRLNENSFDYDRVFDGATLFHISGISFALSDSSRALAYRLMREAKARGVKVSFDFNYRAKLWSPDRARAAFERALELADIVLASDLDLKVFLNTDADGYFKKYANTEYLVLRNRNPITADTHTVNARFIRNAGGRLEEYVSPQIAFKVTEKVGGGDAFDGAVLHKILVGAELKDAAEFALTAFVMKHRIKGDTFTLSAEQVKSGIPEVFGGKK